MPTKLFVKGQSGNPKGRPPTGMAEIEKIRAALLKTEKKLGKTFYEHFCERAFEDNSVLIALAKKLAPDLKQTESDVKVKTDFGVIILPEKLPAGSPVPDDRNSKIDTSVIDQLSNGTIDG